jgi:hypothetical protein
LTNTAFSTGALVGEFIETDREKKELQKLEEERLAQEAIEEAELLAQQEAEDAEAVEKFGIEYNERTDSDTYAQYQDELIAANDEGLSESDLLQRQRDITAKFEGGFIDPKTNREITLSRQKLDREILKDDYAAWSGSARRALTATLTANPGNTIYDEDGNPIDTRKDVQLRDFEEKYAEIREEFDKNFGDRADSAELWEKFTKGFMTPDDVLREAQRVGQDIFENRVTPGVLNGAVEALVEDNRRLSQEEFEAEILNLINVDVNEVAMPGARAEFRKRLNVAVDRAFIEYNKEIEKREVQHVEQRISLESSQALASSSDHSDDATVSLEGEWIDIGSQIAQLRGFESVDEMEVDGLTGQKLDQLVTSLQSRYYGTAEENRASAEKVVAIFLDSAGYDVVDKNGNVDQSKLDTLLRNKFGGVYRVLNDDSLKPDWESFSFGTDINLGQMQDISQDPKTHGSGIYRRPYREAGLSMIAQVGLEHGRAWMFSDEGLRLTRAQFGDNPSEQDFREVEEFFTTFWSNLNEAIINNEEDISLTGLAQRVFNSTAKESRFGDKFKYDPSDPSPRRNFAYGMYLEMMNFSGPALRAFHNMERETNPVSPGQAYEELVNLKHSSFPGSVVGENYRPGQEDYAGPPRFVNGRPRTGGLYRNRGEALRDANEASQFRTAHNVIMNQRFEEEVEMPIPMTPSGTMLTSAYVPFESEMTYEQALDTQSIIDDRHQEALHRVASFFLGRESEDPELTAASQQFRAKLASLPSNEEKVEYVIKTAAAWGFNLQPMEAGILVTQDAMSPETAANRFFAGSRNNGQEYSVTEAIKKTVLDPAYIEELPPHRGESAANLHKDLSADLGKAGSAAIKKKRRIIAMIESLGIEELSTHSGPGHVEAIEAALHERGWLYRNGMFVPSPDAKDWPGTNHSLLPYNEDWSFSQGLPLTGWFAADESSLRDEGYKPLNPLTDPSEKAFWNAVRNQSIPAQVGTLPNSVSSATHALANKVLDEDEQWMGWDSRRQALHQQYGEKPLSEMLKSRDPKAFEYLAIVLADSGPVGMALAVDGDALEAWADPDAGYTPTTLKERLQELTLVPAGDGIGSYSIEDANGEIYGYLRGGLSAFRGFNNYYVPISLGRPGRPKRTYVTPGSTTPSGLPMPPM